MSMTNIFLTISSKFHRQIKDALICDVIQIYKHRLDTCDVVVQNQIRIHLQGFIVWSFIV